MSMSSPPDGVNAQDCWAGGMASHNYSLYSWICCICWAPQTNGGALRDFNKELAFICNFWMIEWKTCPRRLWDGLLTMIQDKQKINEISFSQVMTGYLFHWRIQTFRMQRWLEIFCLLKFQWVIRPIWWMGCFDLILGVRPDMTQSLGYPGTDPSGTLVCGQYSLFHTPTGSAHRSAHSHFSFTNSHSEWLTCIRLWCGNPIVTYSNKHGEYHAVASVTCIANVK